LSTPLAGDKQYLSVNSPEPELTARVQPKGRVKVKDRIRVEVRVTVRVRVRVSVSVNLNKNNSGAGELPVTDKYKINFEWAKIRFILAQYNINMHIHPEIILKNNTKKFSGRNSLNIIKWHVMRSSPRLVQYHLFGFLSKYCKTVCYPLLHLSIYQP